MDGSRDMPIVVSVFVVVNVAATGVKQNETLSTSALPRRTLLTPSSPPLPGGNVDGMRTSAAEIRDHAAATLSPETQQRLEQFLTPAPVADQAASLFTPTQQPVHILDLGSGTGILAAAVAERSADGSSVVAVEQDANLAVDSKRTLSQVCHNTKVINASVFETLLDPVFDRVILNPPYKKISPIHIPTSAGDVKVTNQYTAFMVYAIQAMADGGECVAIIPRSWMNGGYFKDFRKWLLNECSAMQSHGQEYQLMSNPKNQSKASSNNHSPYHSFLRNH